MRLLLLRDAGSDTAPVIGRAQFEGRRRLRGKERKVSQLSPNLPYVTHGRTAGVSIFIPRARCIRKISKATSSLEPKV